MLIGRAPLCRKWWTPWRIHAASRKAPHPPAPCTSLASAFNEKAQADVINSGNLIALRAADFLSRYSMLFFSRFRGARWRRRARPRRTGLRFSGGRGVDEWRAAAFGRRNYGRVARAATFASSSTERKPINECSWPRYNRLHEDARYVGRAAQNEVRHCLKATLRRDGFSASRAVSGSNPAEADFVRHTGPAALRKRQMQTAIRQIWAFTQLSPPK